MKKKIFLTLASMLSCVCLALGFFACDKGAGTESGDGSSSGGSSEVTVCTHQNTETVQDVVATCIAKGKATIKCKDCGEALETKVIPELGHEYALTGGVAATCASTGTGEYDCVRCDATKTEVIKALGHDFVVTKAPATCTEAGSIKQECAHEGCTECIETPIEADGHVFVNATNRLKAECEDGECMTCGTKIKANVSHNYVLDESSCVAPTCTEKGKTVEKCTACGDLMEEEVDMVDHTVADEDWVLGESYELYDADNCIYRRTDTAICSVCKASQTRYADRVHDLETVVTPATCTTDGVRMPTCQNPECDFEDEENAVYFPGTHNFVNDVCTHCNKSQKPVAGTTTEVEMTDLEGSEINFKDETSGKSTAAITMDKGVTDALKEAIKNASGDTTMELSANALEKDSVLTNPDVQVNLSDEDLARLGDNPIYDLNLKIGEDYVHEMGGKVTVTIPYVLGANEDPNSISIGYIKGTELIIISDATYDAATQTVTFTTEHFSYYTVSRLTSEEICEKKFGGHHYVKSVLNPTCVTSGYYYELCTRCGKQSEHCVPYIKPLGHDMKEVAGTKVAAGCTSIGHVDLKCDREGCEYQYTKYTAPTGHTWGEETVEAATCMAPGYTEKTCATCQAVCRKDEPQKAHNYAKTVVAATCTTDGYTEYACTNENCTAAHRGDLVSALGHKWDIEVVTCGRGQKCLTCNAAGASATGNHTYEEGICTGCGGGCEHDYAIIDSRVASCTKGGYTKKICNKCHWETVDDITAALGHDYGEDECNRCHKPNLDKIKNLIASLQTNGYTVKLTDFEIKATTNYVLKDKTVVEVEATVDVGEGYVSTKNGVITAYMVGEVTYKTEDDEGVAKITMYGDGEYVYACMESQVTNDPNLSKWKEYSRVSYDMMMAEMSYGMGSSTDNSVSGSIGGSNGGVVVGPSMGESIMPMSMEGEATSFEQMFEQMLALPEMEKLVDMLSTKGDLVYEMLNSAFTTAFVRTETQDGYSFALDMEKLAELNDNLYELTLDGLIDAYAGAGAFNDIKSFVLDLENKTVRELANQIIDYANANDFSTDIIFGAIEAMASGAAGQPISIQGFLNDENIGGLTVSYLVEMMTQKMREEGEAFNYAELVEGIFAQGASINLYNMLGMATEDEGIKDMIYNIIDTFSNVYDMTIVTDRSYAMQSLRVEFSELEMKTWQDKVYDETTKDYVVSEEGTTYVNGIVDVTLGAATIPATAINVKLEYMEQQDIAINGIIKALEQTDSGMAYGWSTKWVSDKNSEYGGYEVPVVKVLMLNNGKVQYYYIDNATDMLTRSEYGGYTVDEEKLSNRVALSTPLIDDISKAASANVSKGCGYLWDLSISGIEDDAYISVGVYTKTGEEAVMPGYYSGHDLVEYTPSYIPEHIRSKMDEDSVECNEYYYTYYRCSDCGEIERHSIHKGHYTVQKYSLKPGVTDCEQGLICFYACKYCGEVDYSYETSGHQTFEKETIVIPTDHGDITVRKRGCACGKEESIITDDFYYNEDNACLFSYNKYTFREWYSLWEYKQNYGYDYENVAAAIAAGEQAYVITRTMGWYNTWVDENGNPCPEYLPINDTTLYHNPSNNEEPAASVQQRYENGNIDDSCIVFRAQYWDTLKPGENIADVRICLCTVTDCDYKLLIYYYDLPTSDPCKRENRTEYKVVDGNGVVKGTVSASNIRDSHDTTSSEVNGGTLWTCANANCTYQHFEKSQHDSYGRTVYNEYWTKLNGEYTEYTLRRYVYSTDNPCQGTVTEIYGKPLDQGGKQNTYTTTNHINHKQIWSVEPTCTQPGRYQYGCDACGYTENYGYYNWDYGYRAHNWQWNNELNCNVCSECGLQSEKPAEHIAMENLTTNTLYGETGMYTIGFLDIYGYSGDFYVTFEFVSLDGDESKNKEAEIQASFASAFDINYSEQFMYNSWHRDTMIRFSVADVKAAAEAAGVSLTDGSYGLAIRLMPMHSSYVDTFVLTGAELSLS